MRDASYIVALVGILFLAIAAIAGLRILRKPDQEPPTRSDTKRAGRAAMFIITAFVLSAVAACIALLGLF